MFLVDINLLVAAHRGDHVHHLPALDFLTQNADATDIMGFADIVLTGFLRITTHPRIFSVPSSPETAIKFLDGILNFPRARRISPGSDHWNIFISLCRKLGARGSFVSDVYFASLALEQGATMVSFDSDFERFPGLRWRNPLES